MRSICFFFATLLFFFFASSAQAATSTMSKALGFDAPVSAFAAPVADLGNERAFAAEPVSDDELASSYGKAAPSRDFMRTAGASYSTGDFQQTGATARVILDNWLTDVAAPLIFSNLAREPNIS